MKQYTVKPTLPEDRAVWDRDTLIYDSWNEFRQGDPHKQDTFRKVLPYGTEFCYWCSIGGQCFALAGDGQSCIANVQSALMASDTPRNKGGWIDSDTCYVIWQPKDHSQSAWRRWQTKWAKRTALVPA